MFSNSFVEKNSEKMQILTQITAIWAEKNYHNLCFQEKTPIF
jgi:hypothetical protein